VSTAAVDWSDADSAVEYWETIARGILEHTAKAAGGTSEIPRGASLASERGEQSTDSGDADQSAFGVHEMPDH
jgi:hypothetical protein